jgi:trans-2,3-dihydro-3-hydroxyanthranilate isomerase
VHEFFVVDVFAERKYAGNQLAVVLGAGDLGADEMLAITREFDYAESTFVCGEQDGGYDVRIFTPGGEIPFAGHPTLGTASVLRELHGGERVTLNLGVGPVPVDFREEAGDTVAWMSPPSPEAGPAQARGRAAELLCLDESEISADYPVQAYSVGVHFLMVPVNSLEALQRARLDVALLTRLREAGQEMTGLYAFCHGGHGADGADAEDAQTTRVSCRMLWEADGPREDAATGSACVCLGGYAASSGYLGPLPFEIRVEQGHEMGRPSLLRLRADGEGAGEPRIAVGGRTIPVARGQLLTG